MDIKTNMVVDAKGLACPMPIVKTKKAMNDLEPGLVMEVHATDKGSKADIKAWAESTGHQYIGTIEEEGILKHYVRKSSGEEKPETKHPQVVTNEELGAKLAENDSIVLLDVREPAEYAFSHIPNAQPFPLEELEDRVAKLNREDTIYVICRTGNRSDLVAQKLTQKGFKNVINVVPGMSKWQGDTVQSL